MNLRFVSDDIYQHKRGPLWYMNQAGQEKRLLGSLDAQTGFLGRSVHMLRSCNDGSARDTVNRAEQVFSVTGSDARLAANIVALPKNCYYPVLRSFR